MNLNLQQQIFKTDSSSSGLTSLRSPGTPNLVASTSNVSTRSSENSLHTVASPFEIYDVPEGSDFQLLSTSRFDLSLKMLDKLLYLRVGDQNSKFTPVRGYLSINVRKPVRISTICLQFNGELNVKLFLKDSPPNPTSPHLKVSKFPIFTQSRTWKYKNNDKVLENDYFSKGSFTYPFQFLIPNNIPESMSNIFGSTQYFLSVTVNPISTSFTKALLSSQELKASLPIQLVQCDTETDVVSTTASDASATGNWRNLLYYKIVVSNRQLAIGDSSRIYIKILPIENLKYKLRSVSVSLDQITLYNAEEYLPESEKAKFHKFLSHTETAQLEYIDLEMLENSTQCWEFDTKIQKIYVTTISKESNKKKMISLVPTTNAIENKICHFKVTHKIKVAIMVEELEFEDDAISLSNSDIISSFSMRTRSQSVDKTLLNSRAEQAENATIRRTATLVPESQDRKKKVELIMEAEVDILKGESTDGKMPPPTYFDAQLAKRSDGPFEEVGTKTYSLLDNLKSKQKIKPGLNFIVPPAYEEVEEFLEPPPYI